MNQREHMINNLLSEIDGYYMNLVYIKDLLKVEEHMLGLQILEEQAPNFIIIVQCALIDSYMLCLMKLFDKSKQAKTIPNLILKCQKNIQLLRSPDEASKRLAEFDERMKHDEYITHAIDTLRLRRDQYHAHNDKKYFGEKIATDTSYLPKYYLCFLLNFTEEVLSYLWYQLSDKKCRETKYNNDLDSLFR